MEVCEAASQPTKNAASTCGKSDQGVAILSTPIVVALAWGGIAASSLLIGYFFSGRHLSNRTIGMVMGFGAGAIIAAIAYELVPESKLIGIDTFIAFGLGAVTFFILDWLIDGRGGSERKSISGPETASSGSAIFLGTLLDAIPESIILGMSVALGGTISFAFLSAVFVSNIPEGAAGTINLQASGIPRNAILGRWVILVIISALCAGIGYALIWLFPGMDGHLIQAFAGGALLTMLADAMMPEAFEHGGKQVGLVTVLGFLLAATLSALQ